MGSHYKVIIIGAGSAGLSARREVAKQTDDYLVVDGGPLGTTCARVGCMPSKVLIQVADDYHRRFKFAEEGIHGGDGLQLDGAQVMQHVRKLRDRFVRGVMGDMEDWLQTHFLAGYARFVDKDTIDVNGTKLTADRFIIATGSKPIVPGPWKPYEKYLVDTDAIFEWEDLPRSVAVIGLGVIGLELGQALARLGVQVTGISLDKAYGSLSDPHVQEEAHTILSDEFPVMLSAVESLQEKDGKLLVKTKDGEVLVEKALVTMGRSPQTKGLDLEKAGASLNDKSQPAYDKNTFHVEGTKAYFVGDVNAARPLLHEASDQGRIAGYNAVREEDHCFRLRPSLAIVFSDPNIALVGETYKALKERNADFVVGKVSFRGQGRAIVKLKEKGLLHVYVEKQSGKLLGAEMIAPDGEHLAHLIVWALGAGFTVKQALAMPFYHPVIAEGLRTALRDAARQIEGALGPLEILRCQEAPVI